MDLIIALSSSNHDSKPFCNSILTGIPCLLKYRFFSFVLVKFPGRSLIKRKSDLLQSKQYKSPQEQSKYPQKCKE